MNSMIDQDVQEVARHKARRARRQPAPLRRVEDPSRSDQHNRPVPVTRPAVAHPWARSLLTALLFGTTSATRRLSVDLLDVYRNRSRRRDREPFDADLIALQRAHHSPFAYLRAAITIAIMTVSTLLAVASVLTLGELQLLAGNSWIGTVLGGLKLPLALVICLGAFVALQRTISTWLRS